MRSRESAAVVRNVAETAFTLGVGLWSVLESAGVVVTMNTTCRLGGCRWNAERLRRSATGATNPFRFPSSSSTMAMKTCLRFLLPKCGREIQVVEAGPVGQWETEWFPPSPLTSATAQRAKHSPYLSPAPVKPLQPLCQPFLNALPGCRCSISANPL
ncbi:hypothetical protein DFJ74DRAFT_687881 [Hyaloraphidium curvatum]|nr:hypothetical protein DFJ74DRAFT_687881 [Hyaloraphidium curvatum]